LCTYQLLPKVVDECVGVLRAGRRPSKVACSVFPLSNCLQNGFVDHLSRFSHLQVLQHHHGAQENCCRICQILQSNNTNSSWMQILQSNNTNSSWMQSIWIRKLNFSHKHPIWGHNSIVDSLCHYLYISTVVHVSNCNEVFHESEKFREFYKLSTQQSL